MNCPQCQHENLTDSVFCQECGAKLERVCPQCRAENAPSAKFCRKCGKLLVAESSAWESPAAQVAAPEGERRQLTVMFCDLVGSTALSEQLDPEEFRELIHAYQRTCAEAIGSWGGHIAQYLGDGLLVYFGYPLAHEDDTQRAVRAGLGIIGAVQQLSLAAIRSDRPLQVRIGIHTGSVVVGAMGDGARHGRLALGDVPNIAARLQGIASPDTLVVSAVTYRMIAGYFTGEDLGSHTLRGISAPMRVYRISAQSEVQSRFELAIQAGLTPLVGREEELQLLCSRWEMVRAGQGQVVLLSGEPGIGKSRLMQALGERLMAEPHVSIESRCSPYYESSALHPVIDNLQELLQLQGAASPQEKLERLEQALSRYRFPQAETVALLAALLSLPHPPGHPPLMLTPQKQRQQTLDTLVTWLLEETERQPVRLAFEDLHWADPSTLEFLDQLIQRVPAARIYVLLTFRGEFTPPWESRSYISHLALVRLRPGHVEEMVEKVTRGKPLPVEVVRQITAKTDGVPLFVEELTKTVLESGLLTEANGHYELTAPLPPLAIPATLQDSLMARLDQLAPFREVAQLGATLGREFSYELIRAVSPLDEATLQKGLRELVAAELLYQRGPLPQARYVFKHALIRDASYESLLRSKRQRFHQRIAEVLEKRFTDTLETQPELVAHHYTSAGLTEQAIPYWQQAGHHAMAHSAYVEAVSHLSKGLELLSSLPQSRQRSQQELALRSALGVALVTTRGYSSPDVAQNYSRAQEVCEGIGDLPQIVPTLYGLWTYHLLRDQREASFALVDRLEQLARSPEARFIATTTRGVTMYWEGDFRGADRHLASAIELYDPAYPRSLAASFSADAALLAHCYRIWCLFQVGQEDQAVELCRQVKELAAQTSSSYAVATALHYETTLSLHLGEVERTRELAEKLIALSLEQQFALFLATGTGAHGWALAQQDALEQGVAELRRGISFLEGMGASVGMAFWLSCIIEGFLKHKRVADALKVLDEAMRPQGLTHYYDAELARLRGELLLLAGTDRAAAKDCFLRALAIARSQGTKMVELRAAMSLSRLLAGEGEPDDAHAILSPVYESFTEGFEQRQLREARALLAQLR